MVSIIIPVLNEERAIRELLIRLKKVKGSKEVIVVDGGSTDKTVEIASKYGKVISSQRGRANQMNTGAKAAKGSILWFVHCDSIVSTNSIKAINSVIDQGYNGGGFQLYFYDLNTLFMKFVSKTSNWRAKYLGLYFGDQGLFVKRDVFFALGGYPSIEIMEDWAFSRKFKKYGNIKMASEKIGTSARRFKTGGQLSTLLLMHKMKILYMLGVSPAKLKEIYREAR